MLINAIEGIVENGKIRLREDISLPESTKVYVIVTDQNDGSAPKIRTPRLAHPEQFKDFHKQIVEAPANAKL
jgi:hypothetical protein